MGWVLPVWVAWTSEDQARVLHAVEHARELEHEERRWAYAAAAGSEWLALPAHIVMLSLALWHAMLVAWHLAARRQQ